MELFSGIIANQTPAKQTATATISTLCDRLQHATLLEDRRAAVQGLRSFAREYKESVASEGLRALIGTLGKDAEDTDTVKVVLETLLLLFAKDDLNPESSDDIALWLTDEFTQKQDNISLIIDLLITTDFYSRLYALQILAAIIRNRPERTRECVFTAPLGISRLVSILDDKREIIRNEGVLLLTALTESHSDIQKLVAFENAFDRCFKIVEIEGGVDGGIIVQDCLRLISNLLAFNVSNQSYFRETSGFPRLARLFKVEGEAPVFAKELRTVNLCHSIAICRLFVAPGGTGASSNQISFWQNGITAQVLQLAFDKAQDISVKTQALGALADMIRSNSALQENFAQLQVESPNQAAQQITADEQLLQNGNEKVYVIEGLLDMALLSTSVSVASLNMRIAASKCIEGYFFDNSPIRMHFLNRAIDGFTSGADETANILLALMELDSDARADPYKTWLSSVIFYHLINDDPEAKKVTLGIKNGNEEAGEEVVTAIQTFTANLLSAIQYNLDNRIAVAFLMTLCVFLFDDPDAVDDFLSEGSSVQSLVGVVTQSNKSDILVQGLCAFLLGIIYEFSHKDSPIPRATLHPILKGRMGRDQFVHKLDCLRKHPLIRDFEVSETQQVDRLGLPDIYFESFFVDFLKDNYSRILRSIDKDPGETRGYSMPATRASVEMVESMKSQLESKEEEFSKSQTAYLNLEHQLSQAQEELRRSKETSSMTIQKIKDIAAREIASLQDSLQYLQEQSQSDLASERDVNAKTLQEASQKAQHDLRVEREAHSKAIHDLTTKSRNDIKKEMDLKAREMQDLEMRLEALKMEAVQAAHEESRAELQSELAAERNEHERALIEQENKMIDQQHAAIQKAQKITQEKYEKVLISERESGKQSLRELEVTLTEKMREAVEAAQREVGSERDLVIRKLEDENTSLKKGNDEIKNLRDENRSLKKNSDELKKLKEEIVSLKKGTEELNNLKKENATLKKNSQELKKLKDENSSLQKYTQDLKKLEDEKAVLQKRVKQLEDDLAKQKKGTGKGEQKSSNDGKIHVLNKEIDDMKRSLKESDDKSNGLQTELDDILLVMTDLEDSKKNYKAKAKALGAEVSEDEDEAAEEDDDVD